MVNWVDKEPEFEAWPVGIKYFTDDTTIKYDKGDSCLV